MNAMRSTQLDQKRLELEAALQEWAINESILEAGEQLIFELRITRTAVAIGHIVDEAAIAARKAMLPPDEVNSTCCVRWRLATEDWDKLAALPLNEQQMRVLTLLRDHVNGPIHTSEVGVLGIEWNVGFVRRFNMVLDGINDYVSNRVDGSRYVLRQISQKSGLYAIRKIQNRPREVSTS